MKLYLIIDQSTNSPRIEPTSTHNTQEIPFPSETPAQAFKEHFAHEFNQLTELYEKLQSEEKYQEAKVVLEMSMMVVGEVRKILVKLRDSYILILYFLTKASYFSIISDETLVFSSK